MPITHAESLLTQAQWDALLSMVESSIFDVTLYAWSPKFSVTLSGSVSRPDFDAAAYGGSIARVSAAGAYDLAGNLLGAYDDISTLYSVPSLAVDATGLSSFVVTASGISRSVYNGSVWSAWDAVVSDSTVAFVAATSPTRVHFLTLQNDHYQFHVADYAGSWTVTDSDLVWGFPITSFSAKRLNGQDVLAFTANSPGVPSAKTVNLQVVKYILPVGGVHIVTYKYGTWSDHVEIDHVDQWSSFRYRDRVKLSTFNNTLWLTCYSSEGTDKQPIAGTRLYQSKDGLHWSRGELITLPFNPKWGVSLQLLGNTVYALGRKGGASSESTLRFGTVHPNTQLNLTNYITELSVNRHDIQQLSMAVDNHDNWLMGTILGQYRTFALSFSTGFWVSGTSAWQQQGLFEVDTIQPGQAQPLKTLRITARDRLMWMNSKTQSEQFVNWTPQALGLDQYYDPDGTGYGGLEHTFPAENSNASFKAHDGLLFLTNSNISGVGLSTFVNSMWNGSVQSGFGLASAANHEFAGLAFRCYDADNGMFYYYDQESTRLKLIRVVGGVWTQLWQSATKSWGSVASRYLRVDFRYSTIQLFSSSVTPASNADIPWTLEDTVILDGHADAASTEAGFVGTIGKGFSDLNNFSDDPGFIVPGVLPPWLDPYLPGVPLPFPAYTVDTLPTKLIILDSGSAACHIATTLHIEDMVPVPDYVSAGSGLTGTNIDLTADPWNYDRYFALQSTGLFRNDSPFTGSSWSLVADYATMFGNASAQPYQIEMSINRSGYIAIRTGYNGFAYSFNLGATWNHTSINGATYNSTFSGLAGFLLGITGHFAVSPYNNGAQGWVYAAVPSLEGAVNGGYYKSADWGATWTLKLSIANSVVEGGANLSVPYMKPGGLAANINDSSQIVYAASGADNNEDAFIISPDGGTTWNYVVNHSHFGGNAPFSTGGGTALVSFTWDGGVILAASNKTFMHIYDYDALVAGAWDSSSGYCPGYEFVGTPGRWSMKLNGFSSHRWARLLYYGSSPIFYWGFTPDASMTAVSAPGGYTGVGSLEWKIDL